MSSALKKGVAHIVEKKKKPNTFQILKNAIANRTKLKKKRKTLFDVLHFLPNFGVGQHIRKKKWHGFASIQLTNVKIGPDGRHGKAYGIKYWNGVPLNERPKRIFGVHKYIWRYVPEEKLQKQIVKRLEEEKRKEYVEKLREQIKRLSL